MGMLRPRRVTPAGRAASRANGSKSKGPKTASGKKISSMNSLKDGSHSQAALRPLWQSMTVLGEDPKRFQAILRDVISSYMPRNAMELALCDEITQVRLKLERIRRAQEAMLLSTFQKLENSRMRNLREMQSGSGYDAPQTEVLENGLLAAKDSPAKFTEVEACLARLQDQVKEKFFDDETELQALYGRKPTFRGAGIINAFRALSKNSDDEELLASFRVMIREEERNLAEARNAYLQDYVEISRPMRLQCLAPVADPEYALLQRHETALSQQFERKVKLLLTIRAARLPEADAEVQCPAPEPIGWIDGASDSDSILPPGSDPKRPRQPKTEEPSLTLEEAAVARELSLLHKMEKPTRRESEQDMREMVRKIRAVYGLPPEPPPQPRTSFAEGPRAANAATEAKEQEAASSNEQPSGGASGQAPRKNGDGPPSS
jgi:hypothetical protein